MTNRVCGTAGDIEDSYDCEEPVLNEEQKHHAEA